LTFVLTTHDAGGLTQADLDLAHAIDAIVGQHGSAAG
jgi:pterin-4a-carbinolamine dehydratase